MKITMLFAAMLGAFALYAAADPAAQIKEAEAILATKTDSRSRYKALTQKFNAMHKLKQVAAAEAFWLDAIKNDKNLQPNARRAMLNALAGKNLWNGRHVFAMDLLTQATKIELPVNDGAYFFSYWYQAHLYNSRFRDYQKAIDILTMLVGKKMHPAYISDSYGLMGAVYVKLNKKAEALDAYKKAIEFGKKGRRKTARYEKQVELLSK